MQQHWKSAGSYSTVGLEFALSVVLGLLVGQWLDEKFGAGGWLTALWFLFGLIAGSRSIYRALLRANRDAELQQEEDEQAKRKYLDDSPKR